MIPLLTKKLIDGFSFSSLSPAQFVVFGGAFLLQAIVGGVSVYLLGKVGQEVVAKLRETLWSKLLALPVSYFDERQSGAGDGDRRTERLGQNDPIRATGKVL